jgi:hypothetical protein
MNGTYSVNGKGFDSFLEAIAAARAERAEVIEVATGLRRWSPPAPAKKRQRHVIVNADGTVTEIGKVRQ